MSKIAQIALEIHLEEKDVIFKEGDSGSSLFIIISGKVDMGEIPLQTLSERQKQIFYNSKHGIYEIL